MSASACASAPVLVPGVAGHGAHPRQVGAGAERLFRARRRTTARRSSSLRSAKTRVRFGDHAVVEGVAHVGAVEPDAGDVRRGRWISRVVVVVIVKALRSFGQHPRQVELRGRPAERGDRRRDLAAVVRAVVEHMRERCRESGASPTPSVGGIPGCRQIAPRARRRSAAARPRPVEQPLGAGRAVGSGRADGLGDALAGTPPPGACSVTSRWFSVPCDARRKARVAPVFLFGRRRRARRAASSPTGRNGRASRSGSEACIVASFVLNTASPPSSSITSVAPPPMARMRRHRQQALDRRAAQAMPPWNCWQVPRPR